MVNRQFTTMFIHSIKITDTKYNKDNNKYSPVAELMMILVQSADLIIHTSSYKTLYNLLTNNNDNNDKNNYIEEYLDNNFEYLFDKMHEIIMFNIVVWFKNK